MKELINQTKSELAVKINQFNNIVDEELSVAVIKEIAEIEDKLNNYYKKAKELVM